MFIQVKLSFSPGLSIYGYQIVVQLLAYMSPAIVLGDLSKYSELLTENQGRPLRCLSILWALGQCGHKVRNFVAVLTARCRITHPWKLMEIHYSSLPSLEISFRLSFVRLSITRLRVYKGFPAPTMNPIQIAQIAGWSLVRFINPS